jgi:ApaG protein
MGTDYKRFGGFRRFRGFKGFTDGFKRFAMSFVSHRFVPSACQHGQRREAAEGGIRLRQLAEHESAAAVADDDARVTARRAQTGRRRRTFLLPTLTTIVHHLPMFTSEAVTRGVRVAVQSEYAPDRSRPADQQWFFLYTITITNESDETVQLLSRHWIITNADGEIQEVRGQGVIGQQPVLSPGESFTYTSGCSLTTSFGKMEGTYQMTAPTGQAFDVKIAAFALSEPYAVH